MGARREASSNFLACVLHSGWCGQTILPSPEDNQLLSCIVAQLLYSNQERSNLNSCWTPPHLPAPHASVPVPPSLAAHPTPHSPQTIAEMTQLYIARLRALRAVDEMLDAVGGWLPYGTSRTVHPYMPSSPGQHLKINDARCRWTQHTRTPLCHTLRSPHRILLHTSQPLHNHFPTVLVLPRAIDFTSRPLAPSPFRPLAPLAPGVAPQCPDCRSEVCWTTPTSYTPPTTASTWASTACTAARWVPARR